MEVTAEDIRSIGVTAKTGGIPHDGLAHFMRQCAMTHENNEYYSFVYLLSRFMSPDYAYVLGLELGRDTYALAMGCPSCDVTAVELSGKTASTWMEFVGQCINVRIVNGTDTTEWLVNPHNRKRKLDLAIVDSSHEWPIPMIEWYLLRPLMRPGSVVLFDDAGHDGPRRVLNEIAMPKVSFGPDDLVSLHGQNGFCAVLIPGE